MKKIIVVILIAILLFIITIAGKSPIGEEAPPVFDIANIIAKNKFRYFLLTPIVFNKTNTIVMA